MKSGRSFLKSALLLAGLSAVAASMVLPQPAQAQGRGIFGALFGIFSGEGPSHRQAPMSYADPSDPSTSRSRDRSGDLGERTRQGRGGTAFCVRMCDGRYFPVTSASSAPEATCNAMCPAAQTRIFWGSQSGPGAASNGQSYSDTDNAYVFRDKIVEGCTCNGKTAYGLVPVDIKDDTTLRRGDMVATHEGVKVFNGNTRVGHNASDFDLAVNYTKLPTDMRRHLATMSVTPAGTADQDQSQNRH